MSPDRHPLGNPSGAAPGRKRHGRSVAGVVALGMAVLAFRGSLWIAQDRGRIERWALEQAQADWNAARRVVEGFQTEAGAGALYGENPKLWGTFATREAFLKAAAGWRARIGPLPPTIPSLRSDRFGHRIGWRGGRCSISFKTDQGAWLDLAWDGPSTRATRQVIAIHVRETP